ncbi:MAG: ribonuclease P protein component [Actinomycetota bacterium]
MISRIQTRQIFHRLQAEGTYVRSGTLWGSMLIDSGWAQPAIAYALGRQVGGAVQRNLLRRRLRELFRAKSMRILPGFYLVGAASGATKLSFVELGQEVDSLLERCAQKAEK